MSTEKASAEECCPQFDPTPWNDVMVEWENKKFIRDKVCTIFYMPLNFGGAMRRLDAAVRRSGAEMPDYLCLSEHTSPWNLNVFLAVDREIPEAENTELNGKYYCKVYEGPFKDSGKWHADFHKTTEEKGLKPDKTYMWYTTCPKCAKKYKANYVVFLGRIE